MATLFNQRALDEAKNESLRLKTLVSDLEKQNKELPVHIHEIETKIADLEKQKTSLRQELTKRNSELTKVHSAYPEAKRQLDQVTEQQERLSRELSDQKKTK